MDGKPEWLSIELASSQDKANTFAFSNVNFIAYKRMDWKVLAITQPTLSL
jgi:hypothetical protein